jgi:hypothetical protein
MRLPAAFAFRVAPAADIALAAEIALAVRVAVDIDVALNIAIALVIETACAVGAALTAKVTILTIADWRAVRGLTTSRLRFQPSIVRSGEPMDFLSHRLNFPIDPSRFMPKHVLSSLALREALHNGRFGNILIDNDRQTID